MQETINNRLMTTPFYIFFLCSFVILTYFLCSPKIFAQGMGGGRMGMGRGMRNQNTQQANNTPDPPKRQNPFALDAAPVEGLEARTAALENFIFGSEQKKLPIKQRVARL